MRHQILLAMTLSACWVRGPERNGLDGELEFDPAFSTVATGATNHVRVYRTDSDRLCYEGPPNGESCPSSDHIAVAIDAASCGADCTTEVVYDGGDARIDVTATTLDPILELDVHALDGSGAWHDRYPLHAERPVGLRLMSTDGAPIGVSYATEPDASTVVLACLVSVDHGCLPGTHATDLMADGIVDVTEVPPPPQVYDTDEWPDTFVRIHLATSGTGSVHVAALGVDQTLEFRAAAPSDWTAVHFATYHFGTEEIAADATGFLGADVTETHDGRATPMSDLDIVATAVLTDGSRMLISASEVDCTPRNRIMLHSDESHVGAWRGDLQLPDVSKRSPGDAICTVAGHAELGSLTVHVDVQ